MKIELFKCFVFLNFSGDTADEDDSDQDTLKETILETNPYLLGMTIAISILHSIFEFLAFKNGKFQDISKSSQIDLHIFHSQRYFVWYFKILFMKNFIGAIFS